MSMSTSLNVKQSGDREWTMTMMMIMMMMMSDE